MYHIYFVAEIRQQTVRDQWTHMKYHVTLHLVVQSRLGGTKGRTALELEASIGGFETIQKSGLLIRTRSRSAAQDAPFRFKVWLQHRGDLRKLKMNSLRLRPLKRNPSGKVSMQLLGHLPSSQRAVIFKIQVKPLSVPVSEFSVPTCLELLEELAAWESE